MFLAVATAAGQSWNFGGSGRVGKMIKHREIEIRYAELRKLCLEAIRKWPGCETVSALQLTRDGSKPGFSVKVTLCGKADQSIVSRATACVQREMRRQYRLLE